MLTTAIVGAGAPIANGLALAAQARGEDRVTVVNFGDGATSIGAVHEAMNLAGVWKLPVLFLCQNNQIGEYTRIPDYTASPDFASRAAGYGFKGVKLDATDPVGFYQANEGTSSPNCAAARARSSSRPPPSASARMPASATARTCRPRSLPPPKPPGRYPAHPRAAAGSRNLHDEAELHRHGSGGAGRSRAGHRRRNRIQGHDDRGSAGPMSMPTSPRCPAAAIHPHREAEDPFPPAPPKPCCCWKPSAAPRKSALWTEESVFLLGEDIGDPPGGVFATSRGLQKKFGKPVRPTPIAETAIIGAAIGAAIAGMRPVAEIMFNDFPASAWTRSPTTPPSSATWPAANRTCRSPSA